MSVCTEAACTEETFSSECELDAAPERVFEALTDPELVAEWLDTEVPGIGEVERTLVEAAPGERVRYRLHSDDGDHAVDSFVTFTLHETPSGGTLVRLTHDAFVVRQSEPVAMRRAA